MSPNGRSALQKFSEVIKDEKVGLRS